MSTIKHFSVAIVCFLIGVTPFYLCSSRLSGGPKSIASEINNDRVIQGSSLDTDSSRFSESIMFELQDSVRGAMPGYKFRRAVCTCPGIISDQQSYSYGNLERTAKFVADVYIAESRSSIAAKKWMEDSGHLGADRFLTAPNLEAVRLRNGNDRDLMILIRIDKFVVQISGEASAVESLAKLLLRQLPAREQALPADSPLSRRYS